MSRAQCCSEQDRDSAAGLQTRAAVVFVPREGCACARACVFMHVGAAERDSVCFVLTFRGGSARAVLKCAG